MLAIFFSSATDGWQQNPKVRLCHANAAIWRVVISTAPTGGSGAGPTYQWERSDNGAAYADVTSATSLTLADATAVAGHVYAYRCKQTRGVETVTTDAVTAQVYPGGVLAAGTRRTPRLRRSR